MAGWLLNCVYLMALAATSPLWLYRMLRHGRYRRGWGQRLGAAPVRYGLQPVIWVHGVSVGEVNAARPLVAELHAQLPDFRVVVSASTDTGVTAAERAFAPDHQVFRFPLDFSFAVARALNRLRPALVVLMEGDTWPNFLSAAGRRGVPVVVVNGRVGPRKGYPRYRLVRPLAARLFNGLAAIGVQHPVYAQMLRSLGVSDEKIVVTGMMKFDSAEIADRAAGQEELAAALGLTDGRPMLVAGGTGPGEERMLLEALSSRQAGSPLSSARLAIVPRKPERFEEVARLIGRCGLPVVRRSQRPDGAAGEPPPDGAVVLGDTMGELRKFYALAAGVFVGRSLVEMGGSDMIEPAALARPVAFGPHTFNFPQAQSMVAAGAARRVDDAAALMDLFEAWLAVPAAAEELGRRARQFVREQQGATRRNVELICRVLGRQPALAEGGIATDAVAADRQTVGP